MFFNFIIDYLNLKKKYSLRYDLFKLMHRIFYQNLVVQKKKKCKNRDLNFENLFTRIEIFFLHFRRIIKFEEVNIFLKFIRYQILNWTHTSPCSFVLLKIKKKPNATDIVENYDLRYFKVVREYI